MMVGNSSILIMSLLKKSEQHTEVALGQDQMAEIGLYMYDCRYICMYMYTNKQISVDISLYTYIYT
jgi:hypothetical protein